MEPVISTAYYKSGAIKWQSWSLNDEYNREDGPAIIQYYESGAIERQQWWLNGKLHREDGPARIDYDDSGAIVSQQYWWEGIRYPHTKTAKGWDRKVRLLKIQYVMYS